MELLRAESLTAVESDRVDLTARQPLLLLGSEAHPRRLSGVLGPGDWSVPLQNGLLLGVEAVWAARMSPAGLLYQTVKARQESGVECPALWLTDAQQVLLRRALPEHQVVTLSGCRWSSDDGRRVLTAPRLLVALPGVLQIDGQPRAVATLRATGGRYPGALSAEILTWLAEQASAQGLPARSPGALVDLAASGVEGLQQVNALLGRFAGPHSLPTR